MAQKSLWSTWILLPHWKLIQWMMKYWFKAVEHCSNCENSCCWGIGSERVFFQNCQLFDFASSWETSIIAQKDTMICFNLLRCHIQHISSFHKTPFTQHCGFYYDRNPNPSWHIIITEYFAVHQCIQRLLWWANLAFYWIAHTIHAAHAVHATHTTSICTFSTEHPQTCVILVYEINWYPLK